MSTNLKKKLSVVSICLLTSLFACSMDNFSTHLIGHYSGNLPCADCPAITMNIDLKEKAEYQSEMVYQERNQTANEKGSWKVINEKDLSGKEQTILELSPYHSSNKTYFYLQNNTTLQMLDESKIPVPYRELKKHVY